MWNNMCAVICNKCLFRFCLLKVHRSINCIAHAFHKRSALTCWETSHVVSPPWGKCRINTRGMCTHRPLCMSTHTSTHTVSMTPFIPVCLPKKTPQKNKNLEYLHVKHMKKAVIQFFNHVRSVCWLCGSNTKQIILPLTMEAKITRILEDMAILLYNFPLVFTAHLGLMGIYGFAQ